VRNSLRPFVLMARSAIIAVALGALYSCAVGPDFKKPAAPTVSAYLPEAIPEQTVAVAGPAGSAQHFLSGPDVPQNWWQAFNSPQLDALVSEALTANPNVKAAQASLREALEAAAAQRGNYWPQLQAGFAASRQQNAVGVLAPTLGSGQPVFNLYTPQVTVSFVPDLFGGNRRQVESLLASADAARYELDATYLTLINNVIAAVVQMAGLQEQLRQTERIVGLYTESLAVLRHSLSLGAIAEVDIAAQETALAQAEATVPPLRHSIEVQRHQLAALTGHLPAEGPNPKLELSDLQLPSQIPLGVPSQLVEHRPDVLAAQAQLHAATAQVGVAVADMLPQLTISGSEGSVATLMSELFKNGTGFWSAGASLTQTLFAGGSLLHKKRGAEAAMDAAGDTYRATVLQAFQNVADSLHALSTDASVLQASARAAQAAENSYNIARRQLDLGSVNYLYMVLEEQNYLQAQIALVVAQTNRLADTAALYQALGGAPIPPAGH
jgi:NodT family efflux transporter outer membrane factor (OMF) lipoprotein